MNKTSLALLLAAVAAGLGITYLQWQSNGPSSIDVRVPAQLTAQAKQGKALFAANCVSCHGANAGGTDKGPPLIHIYYEPSHHADESFQRAVRNGVQAHHWQFGDMPPAEGVTRDQATLIIRYVREVQRANGIN